jgi:hypothetical protein
MIMILAASIIRVIALMIEAAMTSETLVNFYQTTRRYNPEDSYLPTSARQSIEPSRFEPDATESPNTNLQFYRYTRQLG